MDSLVQLSGTPNNMLEFLPSSNDLPLVLATLALCMRAAQHSVTAASIQTIPRERPYLGAGRHFTTVNQVSSRSPGHP